jgi:hypothetical protein
MTTELYFCVMCHEDPWVGDYDVADLIGECPRCHFSMGIFPVETDGFPRDAETRAQISAAVKSGRVEHLDDIPMGGP